MVAAGAYAALLAAAGSALAAGRTVVVFREGTRTDNGTVGRFHSSALRLTRDCGVPVVPVALLGTRDLLPKHGRLTPSPLEVRLGAPLHPTATSVEALRSAVVALLDDGPATRRTSRLWRATARLVRSRAGLLAAFAWGVAEATSWPVTAEMALVLAARGVHLPAPWTTARMRGAAAEHLAAGPVEMLHQALDGIPVKVYARLAGDAGLDLVHVAGWTLLERGLRTAVVALVVWAVAWVLHPWLRRLWAPYLLVVGAGFAVGLELVVAAWR